MAAYVILSSLVGSWMCIRDCPISVFAGIVTILCFFFSLPAFGNSVTGPGFSLRRRLLMAGALGVLLVSFAATWMLSSMFADAARDSLDRQLDDDLISLLALTESGDDGRLQMRHVPDDLRYDRVFSGTYWQIFDGQGVALLQSRSLWDYTLAFPAESKDGASHAFDLNGPMQQPLRGLVRQVQLPRAQGPLVF
ncbi:hypothetical protein CSC70_13800, partial [Pseudoxanthomonas kalamensis DSM 18571]